MKEDRERAEQVLRRIISFKIFPPGSTTQLNKEDVEEAIDAFVEAEPFKEQKYALIQTALAAARRDEEWEAAAREVIAAFKSKVAPFCSGGATRRAALDALAALMEEK